MKKIIKNKIILILILCIISCSIGVYAATTYKATDVVYNASDGTSMNVNEALNELYNKSGNEGYYYYYENGTVVYYNPISGTKCNASEAVSTTGTKTGCMKWYTFNDDSESSTINLILDHNTTAVIAWYSSEKNILYEDSNAKTEVDKLVSVSKWRDVPRLISVDEILKITGKKNFDSTDYKSPYYLDHNSASRTSSSSVPSRYAWLFDYTFSCTSSGCSIADSSTSGYWTSTNRGTSSEVWQISSSGQLKCRGASYVDHGIRPVITISKSIIS